MRAVYLGIDASENKMESYIKTRKVRKDIVGK
jgi:hypothetical protein